MAMVSRSSSVSLVEHFQPLCITVRREDRYTLGCPSMVIAFTLVTILRQRFPLNGQFNIAVISTFGDDEPLDVVFNSARRMPDLTFYITGNLNMRPKVTRPETENCHNRVLVL
jgi:hypothetical protein